MEKYIELAKKLKELAERGVGGERESAKGKLEIIMRKYGITESDIDGDQEVEMWHKASKKDMLWLFRQVVVSVCQREIAIYEHRGKKGKLGISATPAEHIEIDFRFTMYAKAYEKQLRDFQYGFIVANRIFNTKAESRNYDDLTEEEKDAFNRAKLMANGIRPTEIHKQLRTG